MLIDRQALERLLVDRSLGALPADVESLLSVYLERDPESSDLAREFDETANLVRKVFKEKSLPPLPTFPADKLRHVQLFRNRMVWGAKVAGLAACLLIGIGLGVLFFSPTRSASGLAGTEVVAENRIETGSASTQSAEGFWSTRRLYRHLVNTKRNESIPLFWYSPVKKPSLSGDRL